MTSWGYPCQLVVDHANMKRERSKTHCDRRRNATSLSVGGHDVAMAGPHGAGKETTHRVAAAQRLDVEEGEDLVALEELEGGDVAC